ncbi:glycoside hydrolase family 97 protein [Confluentibacter sediminis]|uniref:glycoside hydrolase family 97 protein n=1 Tax=Confluentibacter sediminis TaxID=2219045 RepID=UPI000DAEF456|nr:glycoside hydrolase family 97 protein [Confluentibacter sediminis]
MRIIFIIFLITLISCNNTKVLKVVSPNSKIEVTIDVESESAQYSINYKDSLFIKPSKLGFELKGAQSLNKNFKVIGVQKSHSNTVWSQVWGENKDIVDNFNKLTVNLQERGHLKRKMNLIFKVYDDGVGFRYEIPEQENIDSISISKELTEFNFSKNDTAWYTPANFDSYEMLYKKAPLSEIASANTPITIETVDGFFASIHEANLTDYAGMTLLQSKHKALSFQCNLVPWPDGVKVKRKAPMLSPWRTIQIADSADKLVESNLILNLNEPNKIKDVSWIEPMKYIGVWWGMHLGTQTWTLGERHGANTIDTERYIDFAHKHNIQGVLVEGWNTGWENWGKKDAFDFVTPYEDFNLKEVTQYAAAKNINFIGHVETGGAAQSFQDHLDEIFSMYHKLGVKTVKTGYAGGIQTKGQYHHGQYMVNHYREVVTTAAKYHIMIDAHEPIKATGIRRTYPNMMTREGVRGMEWNAWSSGNPPDHHTILPFTRGLAGPIDYTPGTFDILYRNAKNRVKWNDLDDGTSRVNTTLAKQLALFVVLYSPLQMASDVIENYENQPAFKFIEDLGVDWETSKVLNGKIGDYITVVRKDKHSDNWFLGSITDENKRNIKVTLSFLDKGKKYRAEIYADGLNTDWKTNPQEINIFQEEVDFKSSLELKLAPGGGQAIRFIAINQ